VAKLIYEFECKDCGSKFDKLMEHKDIAKYLKTTLCSKCGGELYKPPAFGGAITKGADFVKRFR